jgi:hypothetical protein
MKATTTRHYHRRIIPSGNIVPVREHFMSYNTQKRRWNNWQKTTPDWNRVKSENLAHSNERETEINRMFDNLHKTTEKQDGENLALLEYTKSTNPTIGEKDDPRVYPILMIDNANAIILAISRMKGNDKQVANDKYIDEKMESLNSHYRTLKWRKR